MGREDMLNRICRDYSGSGLPEFLSALPASDLQSLLLEVYRKRADALKPADVLRQYRSNRFVKPSGISPVALHRIHMAAFSLAAPLYTPIELSPLSPLGCSSALGPVDQINVVTNVRNTEVCSDLTNSMALECAVRRMELLKNDAHSAKPVRLCADHRLVRTQPFDDPNSFAHFSVFGLCTAGHDEGSHRFEERALREHIDFYLALLHSVESMEYRFRGIELELVLYDPAFKAIAERLAQAYGCVCKEADSKLSYYRAMGLHLYATNMSGETLFLADGGFTDWTAKLTANNKERLLISGIGTDRLAVCFHEPQQAHMERQ